jgi:hypothetical protein
MVIATARHLDDGATELIVQQFRSGDLKRILIDNDDSRLAAPRVTRAIDAIVGAYGQVNTLRDVGRPRHNATTYRACPAWPPRARQLAGWR